MGKIIGWFITIAVIITCVPHLIIWALNHLFALGIDHSAKSWAAIIVLLISINTGRNSK